MSLSEKEKNLIITALITYMRDIESDEDEEDFTSAYTKNMIKDIEELLHKFTK